MAPLRKAPPASQKPHIADDDVNVVQAGRSTTSLWVERAAVDIKRKPMSPGEAECEAFGPNLQRENATANVQRVGQSVRPSRPRHETIGNWDGRASYAPAVSSPSKPPSLQTSVGNNAHESASRSPTKPRSPQIAEPFPNLSSGSLQSPGGWGRKGSHMSIPVQSSTQGRPRILAMSDSAPHQERPKLLHVGRGYSRYPSTIGSKSSSVASPIWNDHPVVTTQPKTPLMRRTTPKGVTDSQSYFEKCGYIDDSISGFDPYVESDKEFILYKDEPDDKHHLPAEDDDRIYKPKILDYVHRRPAISAIGGLILAIGLIFLFIIFPILTYSSRVYRPPGSHNHNNHETWSFINNHTFNLLRNVCHGLIDPDTPESAKTRKSALDGSTLNLVFSDEFNKDGRTFYEGDDPYWAAPNIWYGATKDLEWYDPDGVTTKDGTLQLRMDEFRNHDLQYRSGMLNSWNQFCFKGGVFEVSVSLAGPAGVPGYVDFYPFFS
jgi:hypothetical protein